MAHDHDRQDALLRYTRTAAALHWTIAFLIVLNLSIGFFMEEWPGAARKLAVAIHISSGMTVLMLSAARVAWRVFHKPPPMLPGLHAWERIAAHAVHFLFYGLMFALPLSGWALVSANPPMGSAGAAEIQRRADAAAPDGKASPVRTTGGGRLWFVIPFPAIGSITAVGAEVEGLERQHQFHETSVQYHRVLAWMLLALLALHVAGALKHQILDGQRQLARMAIGAGAGHRKRAGGGADSRE